MNATSRPWNGTGWLAPTLLIAASLGALELYARLGGLPASLLPPPTAIAARLVREWPAIWPHLMVTIGTAAAGFVTANLLALGIASICVHSRKLERALIPLALLLQNVPIVVIYVYLLILLGTGIEPKVVVSMLIAFFPALVVLTTGLKKVDALHWDIMQLYHASRWQIFWKVRWPTAMPYLISSLKTTSTLAFVGTVVGEWMGGSQGIGYLLSIYKAQLRTEHLLASVVAVSLASMASYALVSLVGRRATPWATER